MSPPTPQDPRLSELIEGLVDEVHMPSDYARGLRDGIMAGRAADGSQAGPERAAQVVEAEADKVREVAAHLRRQDRQRTSGRG